MCLAKTYGFHEKVSDATLQAAQHAVSYWNNQLGCQVFILSLKRPEIKFEDVDIIPDKSGDHALADFLTAPVYRRVCIIRKSYMKKTGCITRANIYMVRKYISEFSVDKLETIYRHELGHALGLPDIDPQPYPSLMAPTKEGDIGHPRSANPEDIETLRRTHCERSIFLRHRSWWPIR